MLPSKVNSVTNVNSTNVNNLDFKTLLSNDDNSGYYSLEISTPPTPNTPNENKDEYNESCPANPNYKYLRDYDEDTWNWLLIAELKEFEISRLVIKNDKSEIIKRQILVRKNSNDIAVIEKGIESYGHFVCAINDGCIIYVSSNKKDYKKDGIDYLQKSPLQVSFYDLVNKKELYSIEVNLELEKQFINKQIDHYFLYFHNDKVHIFDMYTKQIERQWQFTAKKNYVPLGKDIRTILNEFVGFFQNRLLVKTDNGYQLLPGNDAEKTILFGNKFTEVKIYENRLVTVHESKGLVVDDAGEEKSCDAETLINSYELNPLTQTFSLIQQWALPIWLQKSMFADNQIILYTSRDSLFGLDLNSLNSEPKLLYKKSENNMSLFANHNFYLFSDNNEIIVKSHATSKEKVVLKCTSEKLGDLINKTYSINGSFIKTVHPNGLVKEKEAENKIEPEELISPRFLK